jgi:hypothetical protein
MIYKYFVTVALRTEAGLIMRTAYIWPIFSCLLLVISFWIFLLLLLYFMLEPDPNLEPELVCVPATAKSCTTLSARVNTSLYKRTKRRKPNIPACRFHLWLGSSLKISAKCTKPVHLITRVTDPL